MNYVMNLVVETIVRKVILLLEFYMRIKRISGLHVVVESILKESDPV